MLFDCQGINLFNFSNASIYVYVQFSREYTKNYVITTRVACSYTIKIIVDSYTTRSSSSSSNTSDLYALSLCGTVIFSHNVIYYVLYNIILLYLLYTPMGYGYCCFNFERFGCVASLLTRRFS